MYICIYVYMYICVYIYIYLSRTYLGYKKLITPCPNWNAPQSNGGICGSISMDFLGFSPPVVPGKAILGWCPYHWKCHADLSGTGRQKCYGITVQKQFLLTNGLKWPKPFVLYLFNLFIFGSQMLVFFLQRAGVITSNQGVSQDEGINITAC